MIVLGLGFIGLSLLAPTNDFSATIHTNPPLSVLVDYNPYQGTLTIRGINQDARPIEFLIGLAILVAGIVLLNRRRFSGIWT
jgi:hypothetical protein